jgi:hypothetical protein
VGIALPSLVSWQEESIHIHCRHLDACCDVGSAYTLAVLSLIVGLPSYPM